MILSHFDLGLFFQILKTKKKRFSKMSFLLIKKSLKIFFQSLEMGIFKLSICKTIQGEISMKIARL